MATAASEQRIQVINEHIEQFVVHPFVLGNLTPGDKLFVRVDPVTGSLDPVIALVDADVEFSKLEELYKEEVLDRVGEAQEYRVVFPEFADRYLGVWSQGGGRRSSLVLDVESDKEYMLLVFGADSWVAGNHVASFGSYRLQIGVNAPGAIEYDAQATGGTVARPVHDLHRAVQEYHGTFSSDGKPVTLPLTGFSVGETLFIHVDTDQPSVNPSVKLRDFGGRLLTYDNLRGSRRKAQSQHIFTVKDQTPSLEIKGLSVAGEAIGGDFRVLVGVNAPEVLLGKASAGGRKLIRSPIPVTVALRVDQITSISQKDENFAVVGHLELGWTDPKLAFNPETCQCNKKVYASDSFRVSAGNKGIRLPSYIFVNQQGKRHSQETTITVRPDGSATWYERFSVTLQAPDFDLRRLPFDTQKFFIRLVLFESAQHFVFVPDLEITQVGDNLGEEEWRIIDLAVSATEAGIREQHSQLNFEMRAQRHMMYYVVRIFVPLGLLIAVSWVSFFMRDYSKRVDVSAGNLLAFIAFNFTLGTDLPRLGYLTFLDHLMVIAFIFAALMVIYNVVMRRFERAGMPKGLEILDSILLWAYPLLYMATVFIVFELTGMGAG